MEDRLSDLKDVATEGSNYYGNPFGQREAERQAQWSGAGQSLGNEEAIISNLAGLDPTRARVDFNKEDHIINLMKGGYMKDVQGDVRDRLDRGQGPSGIGKYASVAIPAVVGTIASLATAGAGSPIASALVSGAYSGLTGLTKGKTSLKDILKNVGTAAGSSIAGSALSYAGKGAMEGFSNAGPSADVMGGGSEAGLYQAGTETTLGDQLSGGLKGAWQGVKDFGSAITPNPSEWFAGAGSPEDLMSPSQMIDEGYKGMIPPEYSNLGKSGLVSALAGLAGELGPQMYGISQLGSSGSGGTTDTRQTTGSTVGYLSGSQGQEDTLSDLQIRASLY
jgi:hypothetical protein